MNAARLILPLAVALWITAAPALATDGVWGEAAPPDYRFWHSTVYDPVNHRMVLFGGFDGINGLNDVWVMDLATPPTWRRLVPDGEPPIERFSQSAVFDAGRNRMIVFGGACNGTSFTPLNDVWVLELSAPAHWTKLVLTGGPTPRFGSTAVFDRVRDRMLVFGGGSNSSGVFSDVWALSFTGTPAWTQLAGNVAPTGGRIWSAAVLDSTGDRMLVEGGAVQGGPGGIQSTDDTWALKLADGTTWTQIVTGNSPGFRYGHTLTFDPVRRQLVVNGGFDTYSSLYPSDTRLLPLGGPLNWSSAPTTGAAPPPGLGGAAIYDSKTETVRFTCGWGEDPSKISTAVWSLRLGTPVGWFPTISPATPPTTGRIEPAVAWDATHRHLIVFGGYTSWVPLGTVYLNDVWIADLAAGGTWTTITPVGGPPAPRSGASLVYDPTGDRVVLFGGEDASTHYDDAWVLTLSGTPTWTPVTPSGAAPTGRAFHGAVYDPTRDRMLTFGGTGDEGSLVYRDVWALSLTGTPDWTKLSPTGSLPALARWGAGVVLDAANDRLLVAGGRTPSGIDSSDVWALSLAGAGAWSRFSIPPGPPARLLAGAAFDPVRHRMLLLGGQTLSSEMGDFWALSFNGSPAWTELHPIGAPDTASGMGAAYDAAGDAMVVYGGTGSFNGLWRYRAADVLAVPAPFHLPPSSLGFTAIAPNPSRAAVDLTFAVPRAEHVTLRIFDVNGRAVAALLDGPAEPGVHTLRWNADRQAAGIYFADLRNPTGHVTRRLVHVR